MKQGGTNWILKSITFVPNAALFTSMLMASCGGCLGSSRCVGDISKNPTLSLFLPQQHTLLRYEDTLFETCRELL